MPGAHPVVSAVRVAATVGVPPVIVGTGAGEIGAVPMTALVVQSRQVPPRVVALATPCSVLPLVPAFTVKGIATFEVEARGVAGTLQVSVLPACVTSAGRVPIVASSRTSATFRVTVVPAAGMATLPVLRADKV